MNDVAQAFAGSLLCAAVGVLLYAAWIGPWLAKRKRKRSEWKPARQRDVVSPTHSATIASDGVSWRIVSGSLPAGMVLNHATGQIAWNVDVCSCCGYIRRARHENMCMMCGTLYKPWNLLDLIETPEQMRDYAERFDPWNAVYFNTRNLDSIGYISAIRDASNFEIKFHRPKKESGMKMTISTNAQLTKGGYVQVETALEMGGKVVDKDISVVDLRDDKHRKILEEAGWKAPKPLFYNIGSISDEMAHVASVFAGGRGAGGSWRDVGMSLSFADTISPPLKFAIGDVVQFLPHGSTTQYLITGISKNPDTQEQLYTYELLGIGKKDALTRTRATMEDGRFAKVGEFKPVKL